MSTLSQLVTAFLAGEKYGRLVERTANLHRKRYTS